MTLWHFTGFSWATRRSACLKTRALSRYGQRSSKAYEDATISLGAASLRPKLRADNHGEARE